MRTMQVFEPGERVWHRATGAEMVVRAVHMRSFKDKDGKDDFYFTLTLECPHCGEELTGRSGRDYEVRGGQTRERAGAEEAPAEGDGARDDQPGGDG